MSIQVHRSLRIRPHLLLACCLALTCLSAASVAQEQALRLAAIDTQRHETALSAASSSWRDLNPRKLKLRSEAVLVVDQAGNVVYAKQADEPSPIASITKLMTAMVIIDSELPLQEKITITREDRDLLKLTGSRLGYGAKLTREQLIRLALMSSENRAANALARTYPGGKTAFVAAMNRKARALGMDQSRFADAAGLDAGNVASARDIFKLARAAHAYALIRDATTTRQMSVRPFKRRGELRFVNTNRLLKNKHWDIELSKTGYINEAGRCLVMEAEIADRPLVIVLLNSFGKLTPFGDSNRIRKWIEQGLNS